MQRMGRSSSMNAQRVGSSQLYSKQIPLRLTNSHQRRSQKSSQLLCRAQSTKSQLNGIRRDVERFFEKYDVVSAGMGALTVTSYFVWRGQEPMTALSITLAATVTALVINEYFFESRQ